MNGVENIHPKEVMERLLKGENLDIVDVREWDELKGGMIPGAKHIPLQEIPNRYTEIVQNIDTVFVCRSGNRSGVACQFLWNLGYRNVKNMAGGMNYWPGDVIRK